MEEATIVKSERLSALMFFLGAGLAGLMAFVRFTEDGFGRNVYISFGLLIAAVYAFISGVRLLWQKPR